MSIGNPHIPTQCCLNCHFLETWHRDDSGETWHSAVSETERDQLGNGEHPHVIFEQDQVLACYKRVWDHANLPEATRKRVKEKGIRTLLAQRRGYSCFFYPHTPGLFLPAASTLERRTADRRAAEKDRALTRRAFRVAFAALIVSIAALLANLFWNIWAHYHPYP